MTVVCLSFSDGSVGRMQFAKRDTSLTDAEVEHEVSKSVFPSGVPIAWRRVSLTDFPQDPTFRNAWTDTGKIEVDMPKAREIHKGNLRALRAPLLAALDIAYIRADEMGDANQKAAIAAKKQALRDVTKDPGIDAATTPEQLNAVLPVALNG